MILFVPRPGEIGETGREEVLPVILDFIRIIEFLPEILRTGQNTGQIVHSSLQHLEYRILRGVVGDIRINPEHQSAVTGEIRAARENDASLAVSQVKRAGSEIAVGQLDGNTLQEQGIRMLVRVFAPVIVPDKQGFQNVIIAASPDRDKCSSNPIFGIK